MQFDVIVIGGGHAGVEAAAVASRRGARVALVTFDGATIGAMSCNPAIGGIGKGHIVREVDAFDGLIARAADAAAIHYRMLNRSKGAAVQGPRIQADRRRFAHAIQRMLDGSRLAVVPAEAIALNIAQGRVTGVALADGIALDAPAVVLATGTFLGGRMFRGSDTSEGGRIDERAATALGQQLRALGLPMARMKTGTPPRLDGRSIDWAALAEQPSDRDPWTMSPISACRTLPQVRCAITRTTAATHDVIRAGLDRSPLQSGAIAGRGPRYCPSIEDKVQRFGDRDGHQIFLEPEGLDTPLVYPNGISTSLPTEVQAAMIASIPGLARARIVVAGYAVEYDHIDPRALDHRLGVECLPGLFCAGQINGTTGYEEASGQGLVAGANAAAHALSVAPLLLDRASSYIGVMIDDLVLQGVTEPYRMLTARAEYRLHLRADNAETRLGELAEQLDCLTPPRRAHLARRREGRRAVDAALSVTSTSVKLRTRGADVADDGSRRDARAWLRAGVSVADAAPELAQAIDSAIIAEAIEDARYEPYRARQAGEVAALRAADAKQLPPEIDYAAIAGLSLEMIERLQRARPPSIGAATRLQGVTPAALTAILLHVERQMPRAA